MRTLQVPVAAAAFLLLLLGSRIEALACSCRVPGPPCQAAFEADVVFEGTVRSISQAGAEAAPEGAARLAPTVVVSFDKVRGYRGDIDATVAVRTSSMGASCGYRFSDGERYVVYAWRGPAGLTTSSCSRTAPVSRATADLAFLRTLGDPAPADGLARVTGTLAPPDGADRESVSGIRITARSADRTFDAATNARGTFELHLPVGTYEIAVQASERYSRTGLTQTVRLPDVRACAALDFYLRYDGRIRGVVQGASGGPVAGATVEAIERGSLGEVGPVHGARTTSDASGAFELTGLPAGKYVLGVDLTRAMDPAVVYPTTFYPGTGDARRAETITLDGGGRITLEPLRLPEPRRPLELTGRVVFDDGSPAAGAFVALVDADASWRQVATGINTSADGTFTFRVHDGLRYVVTASFHDTDLRQQVAARSRPIAAARGMRPVEILLKRPR